MTQITARVPEDLVEELDRAAKTLARSRADVIRQAIEYYLEDLEDLSLGIEALRDPADPVLDWEDVRAKLLDEAAGTP
jgi:transposase